MHREGTPFGQVVIAHRHTCLWVSVAGDHRAQCSPLLTAGQRAAGELLGLPRCHPLGRGAGSSWQCTQVIGGQKGPGLPPRLPPPEQPLPLRTQE